MDLKYWQGKITTCTTPPITVLEFAPDLAEDAIVKLATQIEFAERIVQATERMCCETHIADVAGNIEMLADLLGKYKAALRKRLRFIGA